MQEFHYDSDMIGGSLMVRESRIVAGLLMDGVSKEGWHEAIVSDNLLQKRTVASAKRNATAIRKRLELLTPDFWRALRDGDEELATQVALCGALERNLLLVEFMETSLKDAYLSRAELLDGFVWDDFLADRAHRDAAIHSWADSSKKKMGQVAYRILAEAGYLSSTRGMKLQRVQVRPELRVMLEDHYKHRVRNCLEVSVWNK